LRLALRGNALVAEVRGRGFLLGIDLVDLPDDAHADELVEDVALEHGLLVSTTHSTLDGYAGDEVLLAPAFTSTDEELDLMVRRLAEALAEVARSLVAK
jgi:adenosylmethionine-8-amino-7-oxononanoate aminotransferase